MRRKMESCVQAKHSKSWRDGKIIIIIIMIMVFINAMSNKLKFCVVMVVLLF